MDTSIASFDFEKYLSTYETSDGFTVYNLSLGVHLDFDSINENLFDYYHVTQSDAWTTISYKFYRTIKLWWLVIKCNSDTIDNPMMMPTVGTKIRIAKPILVQNILNALSTQ